MGAVEGCRGDRIFDILCGKTCQVSVFFHIMVVLDTSFNNFLRYLKRC